MKKYILIFTSIFILGLVAMNEIQAVTDTSEFKQPYYTVQISYVGTGAEFRLNDIPFYLESFSGQVDTEIPVSDKMINGINELSIIAFPTNEKGKPLDDWEHNDARVEATLYVREKNAEKKSRKPLTHIKLHPAHDPEEAATASTIFNDQDMPKLDYTSKPYQFSNEAYEKQIVISRKTNEIKTPFPRWEWQDGQAIANTEETYKSLLEAYRKEYAIHQKQDLVAARKSNHKLAETQQMINYYPDLEQAYDILNLEESWKSEEQKLYEFIENDRAKSFGMRLDIIANGKLARIISSSGMQPIVYIINKPRVIVKYKYNFYKNKLGEWIYIM